jgi:hypothetical protein
MKRNWTWDQLDAEAQSYKDGFVDLWLKIKNDLVEGKPLTQKRFCEHFGVAERTFRRWLGDRGKTDPRKKNDFPRHAAKMAASKNSNEEEDEEEEMDEEEQRIREDAAKMTDEEWAKKYPGEWREIVSTEVESMIQDAGFKIRKALRQKALVKNWNREEEKQFLSELDTVKAAIANFEESCASRLRRRPIARSAEQPKLTVVK